VFRKRRGVADVSTKENLTKWSGMVKTPDHRRPLAEKGFGVIGQIGQVFTVSHYPIRNHEKYPIG
jgi:hypothetical protein